MKTKLMALCVVGAVLANTVAAQASFLVFDQCFEENAEGIVAFPGPVTRVASGEGSLRVPSASGSYHAEVTLTGIYGNGFYTQNGGYSDQWPGYIKQSIKVYIDPEAGQIGDGWWWDAAISKEGGGWGAGGGFGVQKTAENTWSLGADDVYGGFQYVGQTRWEHDNTDPLEIGVAGWYTLTTEWVNSTTEPNLIDQVNTVRNYNGDLLWIDTVVGCMSQLPGSTNSPRSAGGISYSWLGSQAAKNGADPYDPYDPHPYETGEFIYVPQNTMTVLAFDDVRAGIIPEPTSLLLLALGGVCLMLRRRRR